MCYWFLSRPGRSIIGFINLYNKRKSRNSSYSRYFNGIRGAIVKTLVFGRRKNVVRSLLELPTLKHVSIFYNLRLIVADKDDDKFVDCAFAANADYIITNDHHFDVLKTIGFPNIPTLKLDELRQFLLKNRHNIALTLRQAQWYIDRQPPIRRFLIF